MVDPVIPCVFENDIQRLATWIDVNLDQAQSIFSAVPLANFYLVFGSLDSEDNEEQQLSNIMCEVISKLLRPFSYDMIMQDENNQVANASNIILITIPLIDMAH